MPIPSRTTGIVLITITSILWGTTGTAATFAPGVGPLAMGAAALGLGGIGQALIALPALRRSATALWRSRGIVASGSLATFVYPLAFYTSMRLSGVAIGTVITLASAPLAAGALERIADRTRVSRAWLLAAALGVAGSALLAATGGGALAGEGGAGVGGVGGGVGSMVAGIALGLISGITYTTFTWSVRRLIDTGVGRAPAIGAVMGFGGVLLMPVLVLTGAPLVQSGPNAAVGAYMVLVPMFLGYLLFGYGLERIPASTATVITLIEPAVATLLAVAVVGERLGVAGWLGLAMIAATLPLLVLAPRAAGRDGAAPAWGS